MALAGSKFKTDIASVIVYAMIHCKQPLSFSNNRTPLVGSRYVHVTMNMNLTNNVKVTKKLRILKKLFPQSLEGVGTYPSFWNFCGVPWSMLYKHPRALIQVSVWLGKS